MGFKVRDAPQGLASSLQNESRTRCVPRFPETAAHNAFLLQPPSSQVAVIYYSRSGRLVTLANVIAEGVRQVRPRNVHTRLDRDMAR